MIRYVKGKGWVYTNPHTGEETVSGGRNSQTTNAASAMSPQNTARYYDPSKDYSGQHQNLFNAVANGGPSFGSWTNHLNYRLEKAKKDGFWDSYTTGRIASGNPYTSGYGFMGYNEKKQSSGMGYDIMDRNNAIFDMLRKGWSWHQIHDITNGKLDPSKSKANYKDFYRDIGYDPSSGQSLEDAIASGPSWVKDFYQIDGMSNSGGGMLGGPINSGGRKERKGTWGSGYSDGGYSLLGKENQAMKKAMELNNGL